MAKLRLEDVRREIENYGWKLISDTYINLEAELTLECPEQHRVYISLNKFRKGQKCPTCEANPYKEMDTKVIPKPQGVMRYLALDQATYVTGWAIYDGTKLIKYGTYETSLGDEISRIHAVGEWLISMINNWKPDVIALEDIQLQDFSQQNAKYQNTTGIQTFKILAQLQGALLNVLCEFKVPYRIVHSSTWRAHCKVNGRTKADKKKSMQLLVKQMFDISVTNDEADAIGIGKYLSDTYSKGMEVEDWG